MKKRFEMIKEQQRDLKEKIIDFKKNRGVNYNFWLKQLNINKGVLSGWITDNRNLPIYVEEELRELVNNYENKK
ncbi:UNVERIFIED_ORG: hypothetical protein B2H93_14755 [Clostridium botulinum]